MEKENIDNIMKIEDGKVQVSQKKYQKQNEINYIAFCLGYDLLNNKLSNSEKNECDNVYNFCNYLAEKFIKTDYYKNTNKSTYDNLRRWLENNKDIIQSEYLFFTGKDNKIFLETGERCGDKVALVKHCFKDGTKEYIIAFHYEIDEKRVNWGYGVYYDNDLKKAKEDFEKVKAGESISDTFKNQNKKTEKNKELAGEIIEQFEELLAKHKIKIPNKNREGNEDESCIFGTDYYDLEDDIVDILEKRKG